jgi:hypothetical protein
MQVLSVLWRSRNSFDLAEGRLPSCTPKSVRQRARGTASHQEGGGLVSKEHAGVNAECDQRVWTNLVWAGSHDGSGR